MPEAVLDFDLAPGPTAPLLAAREVGMEYRTAAGAVRALHGVDLEVPRGGCTVLAGPSGSGKSTLLRILALVERPTSGGVELDGRSVHRLPARRLRALRRGRLALVLQNPTENLLGYLSAADNLRAAAQLAGRPEPRRPAIEELLATLGLDGTADWPLHALSGGQQQRLAFATTLAGGADVLLADEPTSQLDERSAALVVTALRGLAERGLTVLVASHDDVVLDAGDRIARLADGRLLGGLR